MLPSLDGIVQTVLHSQNQFASGGLLLMIIGAVGATLRSIPGRIWSFFLRQATCSITFTNQDSAAKWFKYWFNTLDSAKRIRRTDAYTPWSNDRRIAMLVPAPGVHWIWKGLRPFRISFSRDDDSKASMSTDRKETFTVQTWGRSNKYLNAVLQEVKQAYERQTNEAGLFVYRLREWVSVSSYTPRSMDSIVLPRSTKEFLITDLKRFQNAESWYTSKGIPYHRAYLLHGLPGTGKTSVINALAEYFKLNVYVLNLHTMTDDDLIEAVSEANSSSIFVMEDIDSVKASKNRAAIQESSDDKELKIAGLTLSGLLNALDGIMTPKGSIFFMTTNHIEKLDAALLREGRCDVKMEFGPILWEQKQEMYRMYFDDGNANQFLFANPVETPCQLQEALLREYKRREDNL